MLPTIRKSHTNSYRSLMAKSTRTSPKSKQSKNHIRKTISIPRDVYAVAERRAGAGLRNFSNYVSTLLLRDVAVGQANN